MGIVYKIAENISQLMTKETKYAEIVSTCVPYDDFIHSTYNAIEKLHKLEIGGYSPHQSEGDENTDNIIVLENIKFSNSEPVVDIDECISRIMDIDNMLSARSETFTDLLQQKMETLESVTEYVPQDIAILNELVCKGIYLILG